jgi:hypothetical protein
MKMFRLIMLVVVVLASTAIAASDVLGRNDPPCVYAMQFYKSGMGYYPAGMEGLHYACVVSPPACTYYRPDPVLKPNDYHPCKSGFYLPIIV